MVGPKDDCRNRDRRASKALLGLRWHGVLSGDQSFPIWTAGTQWLTLPVSEGTMHIGKTLFAQVMDFLPWKTFHRIVTPLP